MSLLTIIQGAADLLSLPRPAAVVSSTDQQVRQLFSLANVEGGELARRPQQGWQALTKEYVFITVAAQLQPIAVASDFDFCLPDTAFNRTNSYKLQGPIGAEEWQALQANNVGAVIANIFRIRGSQFLMTPTPAAGDTVAYEYSSAWWAKSSAGQARPAFAADEDSAFLSETLIQLGVIWRFKQAKGLDYGEDMATYEAALQRAIGRDGGSRALSVSGGREHLFGLNIPQTIPV